MWTVSPGLGKVLPSPGEIDCMRVSPCIHACEVGARFRYAMPRSMSMDHKCSSAARPDAQCDPMFGASDILWLSVHHGYSRVPLHLPPGNGGASSECSILAYHRRPPFTSSVSNVTLRPRSSGLTVPAQHQADPLGISSSSSSSSSTIHSTSDRRAKMTPTYLNSNTHFASCSGKASESEGRVSGGGS